MGGELLRDHAADVDRFAALRPPGEEALQERLRGGWLLRRERRVQPGAGGVGCERLVLRPAGDELSLLGAIRRALVAGEEPPDVRVLGVALQETLEQLR